MPTCICCDNGQPFSEKKVCPLCGHEFRGTGWWGIDSHWKKNHQEVLPYLEFKAGLCPGHRGSTRAGFPATEKGSSPAKIVNEAVRKAVQQRSSHVENVLVHALVAAIARVVWQRDPWLDFQVFQAEVDDSGFDLVLSCGGKMRYIQIKQSRVGGKATKYSLRLEFSKVIGGCAVVLIYDAETLDISHTLFFGGEPRLTMPPIEKFPKTKSTVKRDEHGARRLREHYRDVPRKEFERFGSIQALVDRLFP